MRTTIGSRKLAASTTGKDIILAIIGEIGTAGGTGYALEYAAARRSARCRWKGA